MSNQEHYRRILDDSGCILRGKFFFALKKIDVVSKTYINLDPVFTDPVKLRMFAHALISPYRGQYNCIVGPAVGGIPLVYTAAMATIDGLDMTQQCHQLTTAFGEKEGTGFKFDRMGFASAVRERRVLIVEDISSTGNTTRAVADLVRQAGGEPIGVSMIWNRGGFNANIVGLPRMNALINEKVETWRVEDNPPGWGDLPLIADIGHPENYPNYPGPKKNLLTA